MDDTRNDNIEIEKEVLLLVEGGDDKRLFDALIKHLSLPPVQIISYEGKNKFKNKIGVIATKTPGFQNISCIGIARDADDNPQGAFQSIIDALKSYGLDAPKNPLEITAGKPKIAVMIIPGIGRTGELEDVCLESLNNDPAITCVNQYFECLHNKNIDISRRIAKAKIYVFLASKPEPGKRIGEAAQAGYFNFDDKAYQPFKEFLQLINQ